ncbi:MAG TPA: hypothetical protein PKG96_07475 [Bacilli bacterium]|nr:hypothetical protein [Bacteroidales bacterium]HOD61927.1 hypothetical protein [Bacilli bacterium]
MEKLLITLIFVFLMSCGNNSPKTNNEMKQNPKNEIAENSKEKFENITSKFISEFDISEMLLDKYFGAFGQNYQRIDLKVKSINKKIDSPSEYILTGTTILKNKEVPFEGVIKINTVKKSNLNPYQIDDSTYYTIEINCNYQFVEDKSISGSGIYQGTLDFTLVLDNENKLHNDLWEWWGDGYSNFQFQGTWTSSKGTEYKCIFGDGRLENSGDLDIGDGVFMPNEKYYSYGWKDYDKQLNE